MKLLQNTKSSRRQSCQLGIFVVYRLVMHQEVFLEIVRNAFLALILFVSEIQMKRTLYNHDIQWVFPSVSSYTIESHESNHKECIL